MNNLRRKKTTRDGMTLLEVLLSAVILAGALASLSQLATNGINASLRTEMETMAAIKCQTKLDEILAMPSATQLGINIPYPNSRDWTWTAELHEGPSETLSVLSVTVTRSGNLQNTASWQLSRLVNATQLQASSGREFASGR